MTLRESILQICQHFFSCIDVYHAISDLLRNSNHDPRLDHITAPDPRLITWRRTFWFHYRAVNENQFALCSKSHDRGSTPCRIVFATQLLRNQQKSRAISMMEMKWRRIIHWRKKNDSGIQKKLRLRMLRL